MWTWLDQKFYSSEPEDQIYSANFEVDSNSDAWWEEMVEEIFLREGKLNLA
jgi:hypothetical protein